MTAFDLLAEAERLGVRLVQVSDNLPLTQLSPAELDQFEARARAGGIGIELGTLGLQEVNLRAYLGLARRFGCAFLRLVVDSRGDEPSPEEAVARLKAILTEFEAADVRLTIENNGRLSSVTLAWMVRQLGPTRGHPPGNHRPRTRLGRGERAIPPEIPARWLRSRCDA